jgi:uncharacterized membrane protein
VKHIKDEKAIGENYVPGPYTNFPIFGFYKINFIIFLVCSVWVIIMIITPGLESPGVIMFDNDGLVGIDEHYSEIETYENPFVRVVYHSGDQMCHQKSTRSLIVFDNQMSYCARCFGIFLGLALGAGIVTFVWMDIKWWFLVVGIVPIGLDGGLQLITSYESTNVLRILTGTLLGVVTMIVVGLVIIEMSEYAKQWIRYKKFHSKTVKK